MPLPDWIDWVEPFLPAPAVVVAGVPLSALYAGAAAALAAWLRTRAQVPAPYTRKVFHFLIISAAGATQLLWGLPGVAVFGSVTALLVVYALYRGDGFPFYEAMARPGDAPHRSLFIAVPLLTTALGGVVANVLFPGFATVGYLVTGWGDAVGEPVGTRWGRHRYRVPSLAGVAVTRSVEGSAAVFLVGSAAAAVALLGAGVEPGGAVVVGLACGAAGAAVEAISSHGLDNLTVQLASAGVARALLA
jgi:phytol kinase